MPSQEPTSHASESLITDAPIPVLRPMLPTADRLLPYLKRIDATRTYTNWGPLVSELERRLADHFALPEPTVVTASSGTAALIGAILATAGRARPGRSLALVPGFTFVATAIAVQACGYEPYLVDVGADSWALDPIAVRDHPMLARAGVVVPVAAFGRPIEQEPWLELQRRTGVPIAVDGAGSFEALSGDPRRFIGAIPVALSFHATKTFATGEGGGVTTTDAPLARLVAKALNFGFEDSRDSRSASINGKMSEYHAAVGLAELDDWPAKRAALHHIAQLYRHQMTAAGLGARCIVAPSVASCYVLFRCREIREADAVKKSLTLHNIEFRLWYSGGIHSHRQFRDVAGAPLPVTDALSPLIIGLPVAPDMSDALVARVVRAVSHGVLGPLNPGTP